MPYDAAFGDFPTTTPLIEIDPARVTVLTTSAGDMVKFQAAMSKAIWRPGFRKLSMLVTQDEHLLGLIHFGMPMTMKIRNDYLFPPEERGPDFEIGGALRNYADMSVCVGAQPCAWYWNLGKMLALTATSTGDIFEARYGDDLRGITTTSLWGRGAQYNRIYKYLGLTKGQGHAHISDDEYRALRARAEADGFRQNNDLPIGHPFANHGDLASKTLPSSRWKKGVGGDGSSFRRRMLTFLWEIYPSEAKGFYHGQPRGVWYHPAQPPAQRLDVIQGWYKRWGLPRYERKRDEEPPYTDGFS